MPKLVDLPSSIECVGTKPKIIREYVGCINSDTEEVSIAKMNSPVGWTEPGQTPDFNEYTVVLSGELHVETKKETIIVKAGQAIIAYKGEWIRYSTPIHETEYIAVCVPAFSAETVNRDGE
jgi:ethanolamine utilization protein EutQ (cupin superfamily)